MVKNQIVENYDIIINNNALIRVKVTFTDSVRVLVGKIWKNSIIFVSLELIGSRLANKEFNEFDNVVKSLIGEGFEVSKQYNIGADKTTLTKTIDIVI